MPDEGLAVNKLALGLLSSQPNEVYRSRCVEELKEKLFKMRQKIASLSFGINAGLEKIKLECIELRIQVQLAAEQAIEQITIFNEEFLNEINLFRTGQHQIISFR